MPGSGPVTADEIAGEVAASVGLTEGGAGVRDVVCAVARLEPVAVRKLSRATDLPVPLVSAVCNELRKRGVVSPHRPVRLTHRGREMFRAGPRQAVDTGCPTCARREIVVPNALAPAVRRIAAFARDAPPPRFELDQVHCTVETKVRRVLALYDAGLLDGRRIVLLGDDDLTSLAIRILSERLGARIGGLTVLDVDPAVVRFVRTRLRGARFHIECLVHDLRDPLPDRLRGTADAVFLDPPYTRAGADLFLSRAVEATGSGAGRSVFLSFGASRVETTLAVQREIAELGLVVRRVVRDFNQYAGAGVLGGASDLYELATTAETRPKPARRHAGPLYTADFRMSP
jgi:predicted methyltransferase